MDEILQPLVRLFDRPRDAVVHIVDILLVSYLVYRLLALIRGSRAWRIVTGIFIFVLLLFVSRWLGLYTLSWILEKATLLAPVALVILLLPELRQALEGIGRFGFWSRRIAGFEIESESRTVEELVAAASELAASRIGALVIVERGTPLEDIAENGVRVDATISAPLVCTIFHTGNPLHDGAIVVRDNRIAAAACRLPLSENPRLAPNLHMRHRAAIGITEQRDCVAIVVSEERGAISYVVDGLLRKVAPHELRDALNHDLRGEGQTQRREATRRWHLGRMKEKPSDPTLS